MSTSLAWMQKCVAFGVTLSSSLAFAGGPTTSLILTGTGVVGQAVGENRGTPPPGPGAPSFVPFGRAGNAEAASAGGGAFRPPGAAAEAGARPSSGGGDLAALHGQLLFNARRALAGGDPRAAAQQVAEAKKLGVRGAPHEDSADQVESLLKRFSDLQAGPGADRARYQQSQAQFLMEQAEGLMRYNAFDDAERLTTMARSIPVEYRSFERSPDKLLSAIQAARKSTERGAAGVPTGAPAAPPSELGAGPQGIAAPRRLPGVEQKWARDKGMEEGLIAKAQAALDRGDLRSADLFVAQAESLRVPDQAFVAGEIRPWELRLEIDRQMARRGVAVAGAQSPAGGDFPVNRSLYDPAADRSRTIPAAASGQIGAGPTAAQPASEGMRLVGMAMEALDAGDRDGALRLFKQSWQFEGDLDPATRQLVQDKLFSLGSAPDAAPSSPLEAAELEHQAFQQQLFREVTAEQSAADGMKATDPRGAHERLKALRARVQEAQLDGAAQKHFLAIVDRSLSDLEGYIERNRAQIELDEQNRAVLDDIDRDRRLRLEKQNKLSELVEQFNTLMDEQRFAEAEVVAKQARELDSAADVVQTLEWKVRFVRRQQSMQKIRENSEEGLYAALESVQDSATPFDDREPYVFGDARRWEELTLSRRRLLERESSQMTPAEQEIQQRLRKQVDVRFEKRPLAEVIETLGKMAGINTFLDPQGLHAEGVLSDEPVTLNLSQPVSLRSALNLILEPLHLSYVIENEVLKVTSEHTRDRHLERKAYYVADLVIPIPNFTPSYNMGLPGAIAAAHQALGYGMAAPISGGGPLFLADNQQTGPANASVLAQMRSQGMINAPGNASPGSAGYGPGGLGGATLADFDPLIELITTTIKPDSWDEVGGPGAVQGFPTNLSLVVSQTQEVHEQIADLLEQLRRLQDLQVTIEVRFITLNDNFFERIGIDFDFNIDDNTRLAAIPDDDGPSVAFGLGPDGQPTADQDLQFRQDSFGSAVPQFGGFDVNSAANFGVAILSDIEVFLLLQASTGDSRTNILQAPKVTLFNGQTAFVSDTAQRPFVISIIPVVGDFAAAHQPVIVVLNEGTSLSVQAVVSKDKRFVRLTLVPFFSKIGEVEEFTFAGRTTTSTGTNVADPTNPMMTLQDDVTETREGTTVQLPTFAFTTVTTTVSVPDGGTVLLGGIKRLSEGRTERGVPMLARLPYINRLFKNVGIGRETSSLMMMVTPRIIIQEEEEEKTVGHPLE